MNKSVHAVDHVVYEEVSSSRNSLFALNSDELTNYVCAIVHQILYLMDYFLADKDREMVAVRVY